jgi:hypothetical protein
VKKGMRNPKADVGSCYASQRWPEQFDPTNWQKLIFVASPGFFPRTCRRVSALITEVMTNDQIEHHRTAEVETISLPPMR